jgi:hypothetical protein
MSKARRRAAERKRRESERTPAQVAWESEKYRATIAPPPKWCAWVRTDEEVPRKELFLKHQERESIYRASQSHMHDDKARSVLDSAQRESQIILQEAEKKAESITHNYIKSAVIVLDAEKKAQTIAAQSAVILHKAESVLAGAVEETKKLKAEQNAKAILAGAAEEMNRWEAEKTALAGVQHFEPIVKLDVGGVRVTTSLTTLRRFPDTMIGCMFSGRHALPKGEDGYIFMDRDGTHFRHILNFLRSPEGYQVEVVGADARELRRECTYYGIDQLMFPGTVKSLIYQDINGRPLGSVAVAVDLEGIHTIRDSGEKIEYCTECLRGSFNIGAQM